ncbi:hypothetical protein KJ660_03545, partial [Candidatus Micrarchaeota archaeon]|nr:hypothetical protein [Candidatus Micrarchaeota archaeon]
MPTYQIIKIERGGGGTPKTLHVHAQDLTKEQAEQQAAILRDEYRKANLDTVVGVRETPAVSAPGTFEYEGRKVSGEYYGPPPSERGIELQRKRQQAERAAETGQKPTTAYGGPTKDATQKQIIQAQKEGAAYFISGKKITPGAREVGYTETGGTYSIPSGAKYYPGYTSKLAQPTGEEKAAEIIMGYRKQKIDISKLPKGSTIEGKPVEDY